MNRKLAFISDIHGNIEAFLSVLKDIDEKSIKAEDIYCLGDSVGYGTRPNEVIDLLKQRKIQSVLGNYDKSVGFYLPTDSCNSESDRIKTKSPLTWTAEHTSDENKEYLRTFEEQLTIEAEGYHILLTHGSPLSISDYVFENDLEKQEGIAGDLDEDIIIFGHTHFPYVKRVNKKLFLNAGSVGKSKDGDNRACYCILEVGESIDVQFVRVPYDVEKMAKEIEESELLDSFAQVLRTGRDTK